MLHHFQHTTHSVQNGALQSVLRYLNRNDTRPLTRPELAKAVGYNESYLSHLFADTLHTTLTDYITALRMDDATYLLSNTDLNVAQIAEELGFGSQRSFNRMFLKHTQMTPSAYRAASRLPSAYEGRRDVQHVQQRAHQ